MTPEKFSEAFGVNADLNIIQFSPVQLLSHVWLFGTT